MSTDLLFDLTTFVLAILVGFEVISKVPATLHTPLMSGANSIHGVVVIGALMVTATARGPFGYTIAFVAVTFAAMNVVGGYAVTDRMLEMFKAKPAAGEQAPPSAVGRSAPPPAATDAATPTGTTPIGTSPADTDSRANGSPS